MKIQCETCGRTVLLTPGRDTLHGCRDQAAQDDQALKKTSSAQGYEEDITRAAPPPVLEVLHQRLQKATEEQRLIQEAIRAVEECPEIEKLARAMAGL